MMTRYFTFIGVTTQQSSIMQVFPRWRDRLGLGSDVEILGCDLPIHAAPEMYRQTVERLRDERSQAGALVTTHKMDLYAAAHDLFDVLDPDAHLLEEISCISKDRDRLIARATDPISVGQALGEIAERGYFKETGAHVLCFGAGGAGHAIALHLLRDRDPEDRPPRLVVTDSNPDRLTHLQRIRQAIDVHLTRQQIRSQTRLDCIQTDSPIVNDSLLNDLPPGSIVINATGMGKDLPGSPVTDDGRFPVDSIAWDLNYRGELLFLRQAAAQKEPRNVRVEDGWRCFIYGWTTVIQEVFHRPIPQPELEQLALDAASATRSSPAAEKSRRDL